ncbi:MAG: prolipoprotein diacylglyceryl transferase family protein [Candidatus Limnocylindrales bacterium]
MPPAVIQLNFDPYLRLAGQAVRWETLALAAAVFLALAATAIIAGRHGRQSDGARPAGRDDLLFIVLGIIPGAVIGGRLTYVLIHLDYYQANPSLAIDPSSGGLALSGAVILGTITGIYVAGLLEAPIGRWLDIAAIGLLLGVGLGKLAQVSGGSGQGIVSSADWATAYLGPGPWGVLGADLPAVPAQVFEAIGDAIILALILLAGRFRPFQRANGRRFLLALGGWAVVRFIAATWWRDAAVVGSLKVEQLIDIGILLVALIGLIAIRSHAATIEPTPSAPAPVGSPGSARSASPQGDAP